MKQSYFLLALWLFSSVDSQASTRFFTHEKNSLTGAMVASSSNDLCSVAHSTQAYLGLGQDYDPKANHSGITDIFGGDLARVKATLNFICQIVQQDNKANRPSRLHNIEFINRHFELIRWRPNRIQANRFAANKPLLKNMTDDALLVTKYYIKKAQGSLVKTPQTPHAIYHLPHDEQGLTLEQANSQKEVLTRFRYTKQQVLTGVLSQKKLANPMVWLSRLDLEDALMQGTVMIESTTDQGATFYNVHRNNAIAYDRALTKEQQNRYWYFKKTPAVMGYGKDANHKIAIKPMVTVAGDLNLLGLGKLMLLSHNNQHRLAVLADTGGAFENNHYQLDYLGGYFSGWNDYIKAYRDFSDYFEVRILLLKQ